MGVGVCCSRSRGGRWLSRSRACAQFQFGRGMEFGRLGKKLARRAGSGDRALRACHAPEPLDPSLRTPSGTAHAHFFLGRYDEAASWAAMALQDNPDYQPGLRIAAASNAMAGRPEQAHKAVARLRLLNPTLRVSTLKDVLGPFRRAEDLLRYEEGLRQAGLPE